MGVKCSVELATTKTVEKTVSDATTDGYESVYSGYFNAPAEAPGEGGEVAVRRMDSLDDPKDCV